MYIKMDTPKDFVTWLHVAKVSFPIPLYTLSLVCNFFMLWQCFRIWDLDGRGYHKGMWRLFMKKNTLMIIGVPHSPYS